jgi:hypothetical protein
MFQQAVTVTYRDGTTEDIVLDQWSIGQFGTYCTIKGWKFDSKDPGMMAITMLRYQAFAEKHRDSKTKVTFDAWDATVRDVSGTPGAEVIETVDPTNPATPEE